MKSYQDRANTFILQANAAKENGQLNEAIRAYKEAMALVPAYKTFNLVIADMLLGARRYSEAADAYLEALGGAPDHEPAWIGLGKCQLLLDDHEQATESFRAALKLNSTNPDASYYLALLSGMRGELKEAETLLLKALKQRPGWEEQARREASLKPVFENSRRLANLGRDKRWWEIWK